MSHILHAYSVTVRKQRDQQEQLLGNFDEAGTDLLKLLVDFFRDPESRDWLKPEINAAARVDRVYEPDDGNPDIMAAMIKSGEMGVTSEFVATADEQLGETPVFHRTREHAELVPVLVLAKLPGTRSKGFLITHSPYGRGIKTRFWDAFRDWFGERFPNYHVSLDPTIPSNFYREVIEQDGLKQVTLIRQLKPSDIVDENDRRWFDESNLGTIRTIISPPNRLRRLRKSDILAVLDRQKDLSSLLIFRGQTYDEIRATFIDHQGRKHSIYLGEGSRRAPRAGYDVTEQLKFGENGHPTYESLRQAALDYVDILIESAGGST
jgi:hypothetical protein